MRDGTRGPNNGVNTCIVVGGGLLEKKDGECFVAVEGTIVGAYGL